MFEKVNPYHPDKVSDRIAGAMIDLAYQREENPRTAVEVLLGHGFVYIIAESSVPFAESDVEPIVKRIYGKGATLRLLSIPQDEHLAENQKGSVRCGDNGIFRGYQMTVAQDNLTFLAEKITEKFPYDGKYIISGKDMTVCQSHVDMNDALELEYMLKSDYDMTALINPLGPWTGGPDVDSGATNRKLGSDMGDAVTGGGLHGKDLSKADVSVNIVCHLLAQERRCPVSAMCSIGDDVVRFKVNGEYEDHFYDAIVAKAREYIFEKCGGFEKFAEWGLLRP